MNRGKVAVKRRLGDEHSVVSVLFGAATILLIDVDVALADYPTLPEGRTIVYSHKDMLSKSMLSRIAPDIVVAPLIAHDWDIIDLATRLVELGYHKTLLVASKPLPRAHLVMSEVKSICPEIDLQLIEI